MDTATNITHHKGGCLCGAIGFGVSGELGPPDACHCSQCRKQSGHYWVSTNIPRDRIAVHGDENLTWYSSSEKIRRGFCKICGAFLFWDPMEYPYIAVAMGAFEKPTHIMLDHHIFVSDKGDYYDIADGLPQKG